jgi:hypothetical protein
MEKDRNDQAVTMLPGDFLIGIQRAAARRREIFEWPHLRRPRRSSSYTN